MQFLVEHDGSGREWQTLVQADDSKLDCEA